jgi:hypothetical protein
LFIQFNDRRSPFDVDLVLADVDRDGAADTVDFLVTMCGKRRGVVAVEGQGRQIFDIRFRDPERDGD